MKILAHTNPSQGQSNTKIINLLFQTKALNVMCR